LTVEGSSKKLEAVIPARRHERRGYKIPVARRGSFRGVGGFRGEVAFRGTGAFLGEVTNGHTWKQVTLIIRERVLRGPKPSLQLAGTPGKRINLNVKLKKTKGRHPRDLE